MPWRGRVWAVERGIRRTGAAVLDQALLATGACCVVLDSGLHGRFGMVAPYLAIWD
jgi:hypothetical protein